MLHSFVRKAFPVIFYVSALGMGPVPGADCAAQVAEQKALSRNEYINRYKEIAIRQMHKYGIPASIILAQACLESGNGNSRLAVEANNHFGIKCHDWDGDRIYHDDDAQQECFRKYARAEDSFFDHSEFLRTRPRYGSLFNLGREDYEGWAHGLKAAGYATNPQYATLLIDLIKENKLYQYDTYPSTGGEMLYPETTAPITEDLFVISVDRKVYVTNKKRYVLASPGDTYESLAGEFRLFNHEIIRFNDAVRHSQPAVGERVYIQRKAARVTSGPDTHVVRGGETLHYISQKYGIKLSSLCSMNGLSPVQEVSEGTVLRLR